MNKTTIEWTDYTWNPVTGCTKVSAGCRSCYAETLFTRFGKRWGQPKFTEVKMHPDRLMEPVYLEEKLRGKKVFVCDMSDLFHESVTDEFIFDVFETIWNCPLTIFQILTKRPERALKIMNQVGDKILVAMPLLNVWIGTSVEDQKTADERIPLLLQIPAAVRFLSCEPLIGPIDLNLWTGLNAKNLNMIHWVIAGGESGRMARPMHPDWVRSLRDQCATASVPFFFKQWGHYLPNGQSPAEDAESPGPYLGEPLSYFPDQMDQYDSDLKKYMAWKKKNLVKLDDKGLYAIPYGKSKSGNYLDGKQHLAFPVSQLTAKNS